MRDVKIGLSGQPGGVEEVLVVLQGVHQDHTGRSDDR